MGALCAHAAGSKSLYRNMLMRKGNRHIENNDDDDLYIMLMWRLFVCLSVCHVSSSSNFFPISSNFFNCSPISFLQLFPNFVQLTALTTVLQYNLPIPNIISLYQLPIMPCPIFPAITPTRHTPSY